MTEPSASDRYDAFAAAMDQLYETLRINPHEGDPQGAGVVVNGKTYTTRMLTNLFVAVVYVIREEDHSILIIVPLKFMPNCGIA